MEVRRHWFNLWFVAKAQRRLLSPIEYTQPCNHVLSTQPVVNNNSNQQRQHPLQKPPTTAHVAPMNRGGRSRVTRWLPPATARRMLSVRRAQVCSALDSGRTRAPRTPRTSPRARPCKPASSAPLSRKGVACHGVSSEPTSGAELLVLLRVLLVLDWWMSKNGVVVGKGRHQQQPHCLQRQHHYRRRRTYRTGSASKPTTPVRSAPIKPSSGAAPGSGCMTPAAAACPVTLGPK